MHPSAFVPQICMEQRSACCVNSGKQLEMSLPCLKELSLMYIILTKISECHRETKGKVESNQGLTP